MKTKKFVLTYNQNQKPEELINGLGTSNINETATIALLYGVNVSYPTIVPSQLDHRCIYGEISEQQFNELQEKVRADFKNTPVHLFEKDEEQITFSLFDKGADFPQSLVSSIEPFVFGENSFSGGLENELFGAMPVSVYTALSETIKTSFPELKLYITTKS